MCVQEKVEAVGRALMAASAGRLRWLQYYNLPAQLALGAACSVDTALRQCMYTMLPPREGQAASEPVLLVHEAARRNAPPARAAESTLAPLSRAQPTR